MMMNWHIVTSAQYAAGTKYDGHMYFLSDTHEIYRGEVPFTESVILYDELPVEGIALNRLYINSETLEGKVHNGTEWKTVIAPVADAVVAEGTAPVSGKAVATYVAEKIAEVTGSGDVVTGVEWDSDNHVLDIIKGGGTTTNIKFDGVGVSLTYDAATGNIQLADASGNAIGSAVKLDLERFVSSGEYDAANKQIILYFDADKTESVTIPVGELVDTYTAEALDNSMSLTVENNVVKGKVQISTASGNVITVNDDGLFVAATDISGKMDLVDGAVEGNIATLNADGQVVDSGKTFEDIVPNNKVYQGATLTEAITGATPVKGDIAVVSEPIGETGKVQKTVHQYDGENWIAFDSDYDASKIILPEDWVTTAKIGVIQTLTNGSATVATAGTDVLTALRNMTLKETQPSVTQPGVSFSNNSASEFKAYEVGSTVGVAVTAALSAGTYQYGRIDADGNFESSTSAGISASSWTFTDSEGAEKTGSNTADFGTIEVTDDTNYTVTAKATYEASAYKPATNLKKTATVAGIAAGNKTATTAAITGYRNCFYGTFTHKNELTSALIRSLTKTNAAVKAGTAFNLTIPVDTLRAVIAYPADATTADVLASVKDANASDAQINTAFTMITLDVEGANGYEAKSYKVFYKDWADPVTAANTYKVIL